MAYLKNEIHRRNPGWQLTVIKLPDGRKIIMKIRKVSRTHIKFQWEAPDDVHIENRDGVVRTRRLSWGAVTLTLPDGRKILMTVRRSSAVRIQLGWNASRDVRIYREDPPSLVRDEAQPRHPAPRIF